MSVSEPDYCFGNKAAKELLATSKHILDNPDRRDASMIAMAIQALDHARKWLSRCAECRSQRLRGEEPLCGPLDDEPDLP